MTRLSPRAAWVVACTWGLVVLGAMGATATYLRDAVNNAFLLRSAGVSRQAHTQLQEVMDRQARDLEEMATGLGGDPILDEPRFQERAVTLLRGAPLFSAVAFLSPRYRREWVFPFVMARRAQNTALASPSEERASAQTALAREAPAASGLLDLFSGGVGVQLYAPVIRGGLWEGLVEAPMEMTRVALELIEPAVGKDFRYSIVDERQGQEIYSTLSPTDRSATPAYDSYFTLSLADRVWWILLHPQSPPPALAIVVGALSAEAVLGTMIFYLWRRRR